MRYLSSKPFTIPVRSVTPHRSRLRIGPHHEEVQRQLAAAKPHEFLNSGVMCQICSLGREAKIHENQA